MRVLVNECSKSHTLGFYKGSNVLCMMLLHSLCLAMMVKKTALRNLALAERNYLR